MRKFYTIPLFLICLLPFLTISCKKDRSTEEGGPEMQNEGIMLNSGMMRRGNFFGNVFSDIVLINVQGGTDAELMTKELKEFLELTEVEDEYFIFNIHQTQTMSPEKFQSPISFEEAKVICQENVDLLVTVIDYFKAQRKTVYLVGMGYGAYVVQELIVRDGTDAADKFLILTGRLDMPEVIWESYSKGNTGGFINGTTPFTGEPSLATAFEQNLNKLAAGLSFKRYTEALAKYDDLTDLTYCYGTKDELLGGLSQNERALLITRQANLLELEASHLETIQGLIDEGFRVAFGGE